MAAADEVIAAIDTTALAKHLARKTPEEGPGAAARKKEAEEQKTALLDALEKKANALLELHPTAPEKPASAETPEEQAWPTPHQTILHTLLCTSIRFHTGIHACLSCPLLQSLAELLVVRAFSVVRSDAWHVYRRLPQRLLLNHSRWHSWSCRPGRTPLKRRMLCCMRSGLPAKAACWRPQVRPAAYPIPPHFTHAARGQLCSSMERSVDVLTLRTLAPCEKILSDVVEWTVQQTDL